MTKEKLTIDQLEIRFLKRQLRQHTKYKYFANHPQYIWGVLLTCFAFSLVNWDIKFIFSGLMYTCFVLLISIINKGINKNGNR